MCAQSRLTLCNPMDCSLPGSSVHGISQARILEELPTPPPGDLPNLQIEPVSFVSPALVGKLFTSWANIYSICKKAAGCHAVIKLGWALTLDPASLPSMLIVHLPLLCVGHVLCVYTVGTQILDGKKVVFKMQCEGLALVLRVTSQGK